MMVIYIILFLISVLFYIYSPDYYSESYCYNIFLLFLVSIVFFLRKTIKNKNYFNFHVFFLLSIFFTNFAYPVFIYPTNPEYFSVFTYSFNHRIISRATALSEIAINAYILGVSLYNAKVEIADKNVTYDYFYFFSPGLRIFTKYLAFFLSVLFSIYAIYMVIYEPLEIILNTQIVNIVIVFFVIALIINLYSMKEQVKNNLRLFIRKNVLLLISGILIVLFSLWFGDRGPAIQIFFIMMFAYVYFVKPISLKTLLLLVIGGLFFLTLISYTRGTSSNLRSGSLSGTINEASRQMTTFNTFWNYGMDLIVNNRNLYVACELADKDGLLYGKSYFPYLFAPIPGVPSLLTEAVFNTTPEELSSAYRITEEAGLSWGLGSNAVGDVYMNFGLPGVIICFFFFGFFISKLSKQRDVYSLLAYILIFALAIYYPRSSLFEQLSLVFRAMIILYILFVLTRNPLKRIKTRKN